MSWLFSRALVEEFLPANCSDGEPYAQLNVMPTPHAFWLKDKMTEFSSLSQFGPTLRLLTDTHGEELLMSYLAAFRVRTSAEPAKAQESKGLEADFGWKWPASFAKYSPDTSSWKTRQCSLLGGWESFSETWPRWGLMRDGECSEHITPELTTSEKESGFWPTVRASDGERGGRGDLIQAIRGNTNKHFKMHPTPTASNTKANHMRGADKGKKREPRSYGANGPLNPDWTEWLMGWPIKWTEFGQSATDKYQEWLQQHSPFFHNEKDDYHET
nr:hypothetical protein [Burkholderia multivorans]